MTSWTATSEFSVGLRWWRGRRWLQRQHAGDWLKEDELSELQRWWFFAYLCYGEHLFSYSSKPAMVHLSCTAFKFSNSCAVPVWGGPMVRSWALSVSTVTHPPEAQLTLRPVRQHRPETANIMSVSWPITVVITDCTAVVIWQTTNTPLPGRAPGLFKPGQHSSLIVLRNSGAIKNIIICNAFFF